jgi:hypothetical protein
VGVAVDAASATHVPLELHKAGYTQSRTEAHVVLQLEPMHVYGAQSMGCPLGAMSVCIPSHDAASRDTHCPLDVLHVNIGSQSASLRHVAAHASPEQAKGVHFAVTASSHAPLPLQLPAIVATPFAHEAARHFVVCPTKPPHRSCTTPSQVPAEHAFPALAGGQAGRPFWGAPTTGTHVPDSPLTLHASHIPVHVVLQQTPSTQNGASPAQLDASVHAWPRGMRGEHLPALQ